MSEPKPGGSRSDDDDDFYDDMESFLSTPVRKEVDGDAVSTGVAPSSVADGSAVLPENSADASILADIDKCLDEDDDDEV
jgi:hypothetical protein